MYDHMCQQQCDQRIGYAAGLRPGVQIGARSAYLALRDFDPANVSCGSIASVWRCPSHFRGRDASYLAPPAQIRTGPIRAYGSHLGCLTAKRLAGHG